MSNLIVSHGSKAEHAVSSLNAQSSSPIDVVAYGRAANGLALPHGASLLPMPALDGGKLMAARRTIEFTHRVRAKRYDLAVVAHPDLWKSWLRGPLLLFGYAAGARRVVALQDDGGQTSVPLARALADALWWVVMLCLSGLFARIAIVLLARVPRRQPSKTLPPAGSVVYLRTDIELRGKTLEAGGSMAHTAGIIRALRRRKYQVEFWSSGAVVGVDASAHVRLPVVECANLPQEIAELISGLVQGLGAKRPAKATAFVYQRYSLNNLAGVLLSWRWRVPLVLEVNSSEVRWREQWSRLRFPRLARACERAIFRNAERLITVSDNARRQLLDDNVEAERMETVPNGVDSERFAAASPRSLPLPEGSFVVGFVGLFYPWHGVHVLAEAFTLLHSRHPDARLLLIGEGDEVGRTRAILEAAGVSGFCLMPGKVPYDDVPGYLAASDVLVAPHTNIRNFIGSPVKVFEYMAAGRAIVSSRVGQMAELLRDRETALIVEPDNPLALANALAELHADPGLRRRLGQAAQAEARAFHSWDARVTRILGASTESDNGSIRPIEAVELEQRAS